MGKVRVDGNIETNLLEVAHIHVPEALGEVSIVMIDGHDGVQIGGAENPTALALERLHRRFMRGLLGLPTLTPSNLLYIETRRYPLQIFFARMSVQYVQRLLQLPETDH